MTGWFSCWNAVRNHTRSAGGILINKSEAVVLTAIRKLAVHEENFMVARATLPIVMSFGACLHGQAGICTFIMQCPGCTSDVNYIEAILWDTLTRGIAYPDIQLELLGNKNQDITLEEVLQFVEAKEAGKRSASRLLDSHAVEAAKSTYKKGKQMNVTDKLGPCSYCGKPGHGKGAPAQILRKECPAYGHRCQLCN